MGHYITPDGSYYVGEHVAAGSIEVSERPSDLHSWNGEAWALDKEKQIGAIRTALQNELDRLAKLRNYDSIFTAALRAAYPGPFHDEGVAFAQLMDDTWSQAYAHLALVEAGEAEMPTPEEAVAMMPALVLP